MRIQCCLPDVVEVVGEERLVQWVLSPLEPGGGTAGCAAALVENLPLLPPQPPVGAVEAAVAAVELVTAVSDPP